MFSLAVDTIAHAPVDGDDIVQRPARIFHKLCKERVAAIGKCLHDVLCPMTGGIMAVDGIAGQVGVAAGAAERTTHQRIIAHRFQCGNGRGDFLGRAGNGRVKDRTEHTAGSKRVNIGVMIEDVDAWF